jgi:hypothetical protein
MKACVFFLIQVLPFIVDVGDWALKWTEGNTAMQIFFVMLLFPVIMNAIQYYIIDIFIKKPISEEKSEASNHQNDRGDRSALLEDLENDSESDDLGEIIEGGSEDGEVGNQDGKHSVSKLRAEDEDNEEHK